jgi:hypothetical protein
MEILLKWLDECDDLLVVWRVQGPAIAVTLALAAVFLAGLGALLVLGPADLLASP